MQSSQSTANSKKSSAPIVQPFSHSCQRVLPELEYVPEAILRLWLEGTRLPKTGHGRKESVWGCALLGHTTLSQPVRIADPSWPIRVDARPSSLRVSLYGPSYHTQPPRMPRQRLYDEQLSSQVQQYKARSARGRFQSRLSSRFPSQNRVGCACSGFS